MLSSILSGSSLNRLLALIAVILAFPPVFTQRRQTEGLLMSLSLAIFYAVRGVISSVDSRALSKHVTIRPSQFFAFTEIPAIFAVVYFGLQVLPEWVAEPYQWCLLVSSPVFVLLEGISSMIIILECGERCSQVLSDASNFLKSLVASVCFGIFGTSFYVIRDIYNSGLLSVSSARYRYYL
jgi:hypothetical protein